MLGSFPAVVHTTLASVSGGTVHILQKASLMKMRLEEFLTTCVAPFETEVVRLSSLVCPAVRDWKCIQQAGPPRLQLPSESCYSGRQRRREVGLCKCSSMCY